MPSKRGPEPSLSVVVITRDRPHDVEVCLRAVLANTGVDFDVLVVDQSRQPDTAEHVQRYAATDARVRYMQDDGTGAARARNIGAGHTRGDILVFTDDDCEPAADWLATISRSLAEDAAAGIAFGTVTPAAHDPRDGFIIGFTPKRRLRLRGRLAKLRDAGISANVAIRRTALEATGGFDEMLGPGGYFPCAEDYDLTYRVLSHGYALLHVPEARTVHHGLRDWQSGSGLIQRTYVAIGAAYMKHIRMYDPIGVLLLLQELYRAIANIALNMARRRGPFGFGRLRGLLVGALRSFELDVERERTIYGHLG